MSLNKAIIRMLRYDPLTGELTWRVSTGRVSAGMRAGRSQLNGNGYYEVGVRGRLLLVHRVAYYLMTRCWPRMVDHRDGDTSNNRWDNLRAATPETNMMNRKSPKNKTGHRGVYKNGTHFSAQIRVGGKRVMLGTYPTPEDAAAVYATAQAELHGEFSVATRPEKFRFRREKVLDHCPKS